MVTAPKTRWVILCDGTWNKVEYAEGVRYATNVAKLKTMIRKEDVTDPENPWIQDIFYQAGLGTSGVTRVLSGATGVGVVEKVKECYEHLVKNWNLGDQILIFGFSRGALTARLLGAVIADIGILEARRIGEVNRLFETYRILSFLTPDLDLKKELAKKHLETYRPGSNGSKRNPGRALPPNTLKCIGVWDTVVAMGVPGWSNVTKVRPPMGYNITELKSKVDYAFHALAMHETRADFRPVLWDKPEMRSEAEGGEQILRQVWFVGDHCDVGGGHHVLECDLSDVAFGWMAANLVEFNLLDIDTKAVIALPKPALSWGKMNPHDSRTGIYKYAGKYGRKFEDFPNSPQRFHQSVQGRDEWLSGFKIALKKRPGLLDDLNPYVEAPMKDSWSVVYHKRTWMDALPCSIHSRIEGAYGAVSRFFS